MVEVGYPDKHVEYIHQVLGVANSNARNISQARQSLEHALLELEDAYPGVAAKPYYRLHESRILRDLAHTSSLKAIEISRGGRRQNEATLERITAELGVGSKLFNQALAIGNLALTDLKTTEHGETGTNELLATHSVYGRAVVVAARVLHPFGSEEAREKLISASIMFETAEVLPGRSKGSYVRASNAANALRTERILSRVSNIFRWLGVAANTGIASIESGEFQDAARTLLGRTPHLVTPQVAWDAILQKP